MQGGGGESFRYITGGGDKGLPLRTVMRGKGAQNIAIMCVK